MSFQIENPNHQTKNKPFGVHHHYDDDDVIITRVIPITLDLLRIKQSPPQQKFKNLCSVFSKDTSLDFKVIIFKLNLHYFILKVYSCLIKK